MSDSIIFPFNDHRFAIRVTIARTCPPRFATNILRRVWTGVRHGRDDIMRNNVQVSSDSLFTSRDNSPHPTFRKFSKLCLARVAVIIHWPTQCSAERHDPIKFPSSRRHICPVRLIAPSFWYSSKPAERVLLIITYESCSKHLDDFSNLFA